MHVLHVGLEAPSVRRGGLTQYLTSLRAAQDEMFETSTTWLDPQNHSDSWNVAPVATTRWPGRLRAFARVIRHSDADIVDVHFAVHAAWALASGALRGRPFVVHFQGPWADESVWTGDRRVAVLAKRALERYVLRRADRVVVLSEAFRRLVITTYGVMPSRVHVLAPGFPPPPNVVRHQVREALGFAPHDRVAVMVRRLVPRMGHSVAFDALALSPLWQLVVVGTGPLDDELRQAVEERGLEARVHFHGAVSDDELQNLYAAADVTLVPSLAHEGFGLVVLESLSAGVPVVASDLDGLRDAANLSHHVTLVPAADPAALASALATVRDVGPAVAAVAASRTWTAVAHEHGALYGQLLEQRDPPPLVTFLDHTAQRGGGELAMARLAAGLRSHLWHTHVILGAPGPLERTLRDAGASVEILPMGVTSSVHRDALGHRLAANGVATLRYAVRLRRRLRRLQPQIVHTNSLKALVYGTLATTGLTVPLVGHVRDRWAPPYLSSRVVRALRALVRVRVDALVANSTDTARHLPGHCVVVPSPVDDAFFAVRPFEGLVPVVAVVGRLAPWKGQDFAVRVVELIDPDVPFELWFVGDALFGEGDFKESLLAAIAESPIAHRLRFLGAVADVPALLGDTAVLWLTSQTPEPFGNVVTEAMAAGRAVLVPNEGGPVENVEHGVSGWWYEARDEASAARALTTLLRDAQLRLDLGAVARQRARRWRTDPVAQQMLDVYREVVG
jgi:glycosyltransferase involved in cell wall biosynthesis